MKKKQIVFIMTDTTRFDMLGCYGNPDMKTPNLDALAQEGLRCESAYTCQPVCGPARSTIFTGLYPHSNGSFTNSYPLGANVKTVGQRLRDHGIRTGYIGKWHLDGGDYFGLGVCPDGWEEKYWYDMRCYLEELTEEERVKSRIPATNQEGIPEDFTYAHRCAGRAIDFLKEYKDEDFFMVLSLDEPHDPYLCPEPYASMYADYEFPKAPNVWDTLEGKPFYQKLWAGARLKENRDELKIKPSYFLGCNSYADYEIGKVIDAAKELAPDAAIIYTSDHGDALQSHCLNGKGAAMYDEIARIPMIFYGFDGKGVYKYPISHINLVPTILEYMGLSVPKLMEGPSVLSALNDPSLRVNDYVFTEFTRYEVDHDGFGGLQMMRAVFDGRYKLCIHLLDETDEFYDTETDRYEMVNLIDSEAYSKERDRLHDALLRNMDETRDPFRGYQWECRKWRRDAPAPDYENHRYTRQRENEEYEPRQLDYATGLEMENATRIKAVVK
ncbi:MAG: sulfatase-like hydrolase/transferase [Eubacteriales bacterium]